MSCNWVNNNRKEIYSKVYPILYYGSIDLISLHESKPTLIITCDQDYANGPDSAKEIAKNFKNFLKLSKFQIKWKKTRSVCIVLCSNGYPDDFKKNVKINQIKNIKFSNDKTSNEIVKRGLLEKIFGGVGTQQELPTTP